MFRQAAKGTFRVYLRNPIKHEMLMPLEMKKSDAKNVDLLKAYVVYPIKHEMLMPLEMKKSDAKNVDLLKAFTSRTLNMNLHGWELYIDMQLVTICISLYTFGCIA